MSKGRSWLMPMLFALVVWAGAAGIVFGVVEWRGEAGPPGPQGERGSAGPAGEVGASSCEAEIFDRLTAAGYSTDSARAWAGSTCRDVSGGRGILDYLPQR